MATTPVTPDLHQQLVAELAAISKKHATISYLLIGVLVVVLGVVSLGGYIGLKSYEAQLAKAQATEAQYIADRKTWQAELDAHDAQRTQDAKAEAQLLAQIAQRDKTPPPPAVVTSLQPTATVLETATGLKQAYEGAVDVSVTPDNQLAISQPSAKLIITDKLAGDKAEANFVDGKKAYDLEVTQNTSLTYDLNQCKTQNTEAQTVITAYKKAAVKSKWRKILDGSEKAALLVVGAALGHYL